MGSEDRITPMTISLEFGLVGQSRMLYKTYEKTRIANLS